MPNIVSAVALATMWLQYVFSPRYGLLKDFFTALHLDNLAKIQFLDNDHKFWALLFAYCFGMVGYHMLIWLSGIERISPEYYEAATIDGATKPAQFRYMTLPLLKGVFKTNITMWQIFGGGNTVTERNAGLGAAIGVLLSICVVIVFTVCNKMIKDDDLEF